MTGAWARDLNVGATLRTAAGVFRRQWLGLAVLWLLFDGSTDLVEWATSGGFYMQRGQQPPFQVLLYLAGIVVGGALLAVTAAKVVLADRVTGLSLPPRVAVSPPWSGLTEALILWTLLSAPGLTLQVFGGGDGMLAGFAGLLFGIMDYGAYMIVPLYAALAFHEQETGGSLLQRLRVLTYGARLKLLGVLAGVVFAGTILASVVDTLGVVIGLTIAPGMTSEAGLMREGLKVPGYLAYNAFALFLTAWGPVVYLELRRAAEGLDREGPDIFA